MQKIEFSQKFKHQTKSISIWTASKKKEHRAFIMVNLKLAKENYAKVFDTTGKERLEISETNESNTNVFLNIIMSSHEHKLIIDRKRTLGKENCNKSFSTLEHRLKMNHNVFVEFAAMLYALDFTVTKT